MNSADTIKRHFFINFMLILPAKKEAIASFFAVYYVAERRVCCGKWSSQFWLFRIYEFMTFKSRMIFLYESDILSRWHTVHRHGV